MKLKLYTGMYHLTESENNFQEGFPQKCLQV